MDGIGNLGRLFEMQASYLSCYESYLARGVNQICDPNDKENSFDLPWLKNHYFLIGNDALRIIVSALIQNFREVPQSVLDFPCGSGRVTRHLRAFFPQAQICACDLYGYHVDFCVNELGAEGIISKENFDMIDFGRKFDLIFCGSLLTHLPEDLLRAALRLISRSLSEQGIAIITLHGRHSEYIQKHRFKYLDDDLFAIAESTVQATGFGYVDYPDQFRSTVFDRQARYGVSLCRPHWSLEVIENDYDVRVLGYTERGWDTHQDVLVIGKPAVND